MSNEKNGHNIGPHLGMSDSDFLWWIYERLHFIHGEHKNVDYMLHLAMISNNMSPNLKVQVAGTQRWSLKVYIGVSALIFSIGLLVGKLL